MFTTRLIVSLTEFFLSIGLAIFMVFWSYKSFAQVQTAYDVEGELKKGNVAVAVLLASLMVAASLIMKKSLYPVTSSITIYLTAPGEGAVPLWKLALYCFGHLVLGFMVTIASIELSLRVFERLSTRFDEDEEIARGNTAIAIVMAGVVLVTSSYLQEGVSSLTKALIPRPVLGKVRVVPPALVP
ncbi:MAG: DUF350 domain-containing protein [Elusimicrobia bacterium]|nr:DUF350 domain-containing protein [Elusimicrobiota bacterium]